MPREYQYVLAEEPIPPKPSVRGNILRTAIGQIVTLLTPLPKSEKWYRKPEDRVWFRGLVERDMALLARDIDEDEAALGLAHTPPVATFQNASESQSVRDAVQAERAACVAYLREHPENSISVLSEFIQHGKHREAR